jgi:hypothetical protein
MVKPRRLHRWLVAGALALLVGRPGLPAGAADAPATENAAGRDPFWPVNYQPDPKSAGSGASDADEVLQIRSLSLEEQSYIRGRLRVGGIMQQGRQRVAIINRQVVREGDILTLQRDHRTYRFIVRSLEEKNIILEPAEAEEPSETEE